MCNTCLVAAGVTCPAYWMHAVDYRTDVTKVVTCLPAAVGAKCSWTCALEGMLLRRGNVTATCLANGTWMEDRSEC